jgi:hypothetical protein
MTSKDIAGIIGRRLNVQVVQQALGTGSGALSRPEMETGPLRTRKVCKVRILSVLKERNVRTRNNRGRSARSELMAEIMVDLRRPCRRNTKPGA